MELYEEVPYIVDWIKQQVKTAKKDGVVIGISGGIDSAVVAAISKQATNVLGVSMPMANKTNNSTDRAIELCKKFNIPLISSPIVPVLSYDDSIKNTAYTDLAIGNFHARQRMAKLYYYAELHNYLVIGTDNAVEHFLGFYTKYGDGGTDIEILGEYSKTEVFELGRILDVPETILNAKPSAELWDGQTDEEEIGMSYPKMEEIINNYNRHPDHPLIQRHLSTEHKRNLPPCYQRDNIRR
jgi:NAD+ synthase